MLNGNVVIQTENSQWGESLSVFISPILVTCCEDDNTGVGEKVQSTFCILEFHILGFNHGLKILGKNNKK